MKTHLTINRHTYHIMKQKELFVHIITNNIYIKKKVTI